MKTSLLTPGRLLAALVILGFAGLIYAPQVLLLLGMPMHERWFFDAYAILAANDAVQQGIDVSRYNPLDFTGRPHVYSGWWLELRRLGLTRADNFAFGATIVLAFFAWLVATVRPRTYTAAGWFALVLVSPAAVFAVQRANNDLVVFSVLSVGLVALRREVTAVRLGVFAVAVLVATGLKFYPIVAVAALVPVLPWTRRVVATLAVVAVAGLAILADQRGYLGRGMFVLDQSVYEYGAPIIWRPTGLPRPLALAASAAIIAAVAALLASRGWTRGLAGAGDEAPGERLLFATGACLLVGCFLAGESLVYRLVFAIWLWPWLWRTAGAGDRTARLALVVTLLVLWLDGGCCLFVNIVGLTWRPGLGWRMIVQPVTWLWQALLAGWLLEGTLARWREWRVAPIRG